ncbi:uncharacterized protein LOC141648560 isoform X2 [Silene latifolia]|uniref:uncharacterized protein LOC141648560 isoform X2 n=1 Tax=Silene latifolia TaxID=37657 RepID=UPI003D786196
MATIRSSIRSVLTSGANIIIFTNSKPCSSSFSTLSVTSKLIASPFSSSQTRSMFSASRLASAMVSVVESQKPLHSAIASARLNSILAMDSTCWSSLAQAFAVPR